LIRIESGLKRNANFRPARFSSASRIERKYRLALAAARFRETSLSIPPPPPASRNDVEARASLDGDIVPLRAHPQAADAA